MSLKSSLWHHETIIGSALEYPHSFDIYLENQEVSLLDSQATKEEQLCQDVLLVLVKGENSLLKPRFDYFRHYTNKSIENYLSIKSSYSPVGSAPS